jgi:hypothetical protein
MHPFSAKSISREVIGFALKSRHSFKWVVTIFAIFGLFLNLIVAFWYLHIFLNV